MQNISHVTFSSAEIKHPAENKSVHDHLSLLLLVSTQLEVHATLQWFLHVLLTLHALKLEHNLFGCFSLFSEHRLRLSTKSSLLPVISPLSLRQQRILALFVLGDFEALVNFARRAKSFTRFGHIYHDGNLNLKRKCGHRRRCTKV